MSAADALTLFIGRFERFEADIKGAVADHGKDIDALQETVAVLLRENELTRKSLDRFTNALLVGSISIVGAAAAVILFGPAG